MLRFRPVTIFGRSKDCITFLNCITLRCIALQIWEGNDRLESERAAGRLRRSASPHPDRSVTVTPSKLHDLDGADPIERARLARENVRIALANLRTALTALGAAIQAGRVQRHTARMRRLEAELAELEALYAELGGEDDRPDA